MAGEKNGIRRLGLGYGHALSSVSCRVVLVEFGSEREGERECGHVEELYNEMH